VIDELHASTYRKGSAGALGPTAGYAISLRVELANVPGVLGRLAGEIGSAGGNIGMIDLVEVRNSSLVRDIVVNCCSEDHATMICRTADAVPSVTLVSFTDRTFALHSGGKIEISPKVTVRSNDDLAMAYTPGVGRIAKAIGTDPELVWELTSRGNSVAVLSDGSAILGLGSLGPEAALPVMEGKALLFKLLAGVDAFPLCVRADSVGELAAVGRAVAPTFGAINLEDVAAPECFEVERRLRDDLEIPVFHDDQHGTAIVTLAALLNAARLTGKALEGLRIVVLGMGAAGVAVTRMLLRAGVGDVVGADRRGIIHGGRSEGMNEEKRWISANTNRSDLRGSVEDALKGADCLIGLSGPHLVVPTWLQRMAPEAFVFAMANPVPEVAPEEVPDNVRVVATGRSDYPNQINNALVFPGVFRGLLQARATRYEMAAGLRAAESLASIVEDDELRDDYILPSVFDARVVPAIANAVMEAAEAAGASS
jgi:malate dehydrogenase (oxaloacetate-decarboxylating)